MTDYLHTRASMAIIGTGGTTLFPVTAPSSTLSANSVTVINVISSQYTLTMMISATFDAMWIEGSEIAVADRT